MSCVRAGVSYKRHKWTYKGLQLKWYQMCPACMKQQVMELGKWRPAEMEESGWANMPSVGNDQVSK